VFIDEEFAVVARPRPAQASNRRSGGMMAAP
jgi:hypothetical protein